MKACKCRVNPVREQKSLGVCVDSCFETPSPLRSNDRRSKAMAFSNGVKIFKIKNRKGYAAICCDNLTEGSTVNQALERMEKAHKRSSKRHK